MKRLVLFVVALVFAFCTTVMAADKAVTAPVKEEAVKTEKAPVKKAEKKAVKKAAVKKVKKADKKVVAPEAAPVAK
jgi:hypothetical protein